MMSLVIASRLSQLAFGRSYRGILHRRLHPLLCVGAIGSEIGRLGSVLLTEKRQMRAQVVVTGSLPFAAVGKGRHRLLAGVDKIGDEGFVLDALVAVCGLDGIEIGLGEFRVLERQIGIA